MYVLDRHMANETRIEIRGSGVGIYRPMQRHCREDYQASTTAKVLAYTKRPK